MANTVWEGRMDEWAFNGPASTPEKMRCNAAKASENTNRLHVNTDDKESSGRITPPCSVQETTRKTVTIEGETITLGAESSGIFGTSLFVMLLCLLPTTN